MDESLIGSNGARGTQADGGFVRVRGAREHNLKDVSLEIPRNSLVVFTGVSGSGKSSLAFGTLYAEAQRRYLESVSPYARRLFHQMAVPEVDSVEGLPPGGGASAAAWIADHEVVGR
jgi:excinuclease ABC subunit A